MKLHSYIQVHKRAFRKVPGQFWISQEPVAWLWCNLAVSQRRPYCASV